MPPDNIAGAYLAASSECRPEKIADFRKLDSKNSPKLLIRCDYRTLENEPMRANFREGKIKVTFFGGESAELNLLRARNQPEQREAHSHFEMSGFDWLRVEKLVQNSLAFESLDSAKVYEQKADLPTGMNPQGDILGLQGHAYQIDPTTIKTNEFPDVSQIPSLGKVKLPPFQLEAAHKIEGKVTKLMLQDVPEWFDLKNIGVPLSATKQKYSIGLSYFEGGREIPNSKEIDTFLVSVSGYIDIPASTDSSEKPLVIRFRMNARTAARVFIDGVEVLKTEVPSYSDMLSLSKPLKGEPTLRDQRVSLELLPGLKTIRIDYLHSKFDPLGYTVWMSFDWMLPGIKEWAMVPFWALSHPKPSLQDEEKL